MTTKSNVSHVLRGGSWDNVAVLCRSAFRFNYGPSNRHYDVGFRVARDVSVKSDASCVLRGGSWYSSAEFCRSANRYSGVGPSSRDDLIGFRVVRGFSVKPDVLRGGSWDNNAEFCRSAFRFNYGPSLRYHNIGFRVVKKEKMN